MSALKQFRQKGGFRQLLLLLEVSDSQKQRGLLQLIALEDPGWAHLLKLKILSAEKVLGWTPRYLRPVLSELALDTLFHLYSGCSESQRDVIDLAVTPGLRQNLREMLTTDKPATSHEVFTAGVKVVQCVRELEAVGNLNLEEIDPQLVWEHELVA